MRRTLNSAHSAHTDMQTLARRTRSARPHTEGVPRASLSLPPRYRLQLGSGRRAGESVAWRRTSLARPDRDGILDTCEDCDARVWRILEGLLVPDPLMPEGLLTAAANQSDARYSSTPFASPAYRYVHLPSGVISTGTVTLPRSAMPSPPAYEKRPMSGSLLSPPDKTHSG